MKPIDMGDRRELFCDTVLWQTVGNAFFQLHRPQMQEIALRRDTVADNRLTSYYNILFDGKKYAMFEAIHGSAPRMVKEGRGAYADPCSMLRATVMLLNHIGYQSKASALEQALDICMITEKKLVITGREDGCTCEEFGNYLMETITNLNK